jgi:hypothetical protein
MGLRFDSSLQIAKKALQEWVEILLLDCMNV